MATAAATTRPRRPGLAPDRLSAALYTLAAFLAVLALLAWQFRSAVPAGRRPQVVVRRVYETRIVETVVGSRGGTSATQSVSSSGSAALPAAGPVTRTS